ncbi:hypothetical protein J3A83DRAFT_4090979 [Scleroderma citrinum]
MNSLSRHWCHLYKPFSLDVRCSRNYSQPCFNPFPFPSHPNAQPHDIFHLPGSATQKEIKQRYYDLVRIYHPDSIIARRLPPEVSQERIQAINKAYDTLRGRNVPLDEAVSPTPGRRMDTAWLKARSSRRPYFDDVVGDERWIERTIVVFAVFVIDVSGFRNYKLTIVPQTLVAFIAQTSFTRLQVLKSSTAQQAGSSGRKHVQSDDILAEPSVLNEKS